MSDRFLAISSVKAKTGLGRFLHVVPDLYAHAMTPARPPELAIQKNPPFNLLRRGVRHPSQCLHPLVSNDCLPVALFLSEARDERQQNSDSIFEGDPQCGTPQNGRTKECGEDARPSRGDHR